MRVGLVVVAMVALGIGLAHPAEQTILGKRLVVKDPKPGIDPTKRKVVGQGQERATTNTIVGDPTMAGATLTIFAFGATSTNQSFVLPQANWTATRHGFAYEDRSGVDGAVRMVQIELSQRGTFIIQAVVVGKNGSIVVVPPDPGTSGCLRLAISGGDRYDVLLPPSPNSTIARNDPQKFSIQDALQEGTCPAPACGNGVRDPGEQCDGGPACTSDCRQAIPNCCQGSDQCVAAPGFSLFGNLLQYCNGILPFSTYVPMAGAICGADGSCNSQPLEPISVCCQLAVDACRDDIVPDTEGLWRFHNICQGAESGITMPAAVCGPGGTCVPL